MRCKATHMAALQSALIKRRRLSGGRAERRFPMKRLMISAFAAVLMLAATPSAERPAGFAGMMSLQGFQVSSDVSTLPIEDFEDQSLVFTKAARKAVLSLAGDLHRRRTENSRPGYLRCDQECGHDGRHAD